jgi:hypothetical protein
VDITSNTFYKCTASFRTHYIFGRVKPLSIFIGCETWLLTLREKRGLRVFEYRVLSRIFGPKRLQIKGSGENYIMRSLIITK